MTRAATGLTVVLLETAILGCGAPAGFSRGPTGSLSVLRAPAARGAGEVLFEDDFEGDLSRWELGDETVLRIVDSGDRAHGRVFELSPAHARLAALMRGSEAWRGYRVEGDVLFPEDVQNYLGFIYHYRATNRRVDLGSIYIKGNNSYVRVNPRRDWNPARQMYEEYRTALTGANAIRIGQWQHFAAEVVGSACHFYVGDMTVPRVTFDFYEGSGGKAGFKPRVVGGRVWLDNVRVSAIDELSYRGPRQPEGIVYVPDEMITDWHVLGPLTRAVESVERARRPQGHDVVDDGMTQKWRAFETDPRGAVVTGRVTEFLGSRTVAYFHTTVEVPPGENARVEFSSIDDLALWLDGRFDGYLTRGAVAWYDAGRNPDHPPTDVLSLGPGAHQLLVRVRGGQYATGGFFARLVRGPVVADDVRVSTVPLSTTLESQGRLGGVSVGPHGELYVSNFAADVWRIDPDGTVTVMADSIRGSSGNTVDGRGRLLQASFLDNRILAIEPRGGVSVVASEGLNGPVGLTTDEQGRVYVCNCRGNSVARVNRDGRATTLAAGEPFDCPNGITRGPDRASYVVNFNNPYLVRVADDGDVSIVATLPEGGNAHVAFTRGAFFVTRIASNELYRVTPGGAARRFAGTGSLGAADGPIETATLARPNGIAVSPDGAYLFVNNLIGPWRGHDPTTIVVRRIGPIPREVRGRPPDRVMPGRNPQPATRSPYPILTSSFCISPVTSATPS